MACKPIASHQPVSFAALRSLVFFICNILQRGKAIEMNYMKATSIQQYVPGQHVSAYFGEVQKLKRANRLEEAIATLLELIDATEEDSIFTGLGVAPAYYEELAIIYRQRKEFGKEIGILARYARQRHAPADPRQEILKERLEKAKQLFTKNKYPGSAKG